MTLTAGPVDARNEIIEEFRANAMMQAGGAAGRQSSMAEIRIFRWSTDEEREEILEAIKGATGGRPNNRQVAQALRGQKKTGFAFFAGRQGYPLRYSREVMVDGKRQIVLATDRPVSFQEVYSRSQLGDFDVSLIILKVDDDGNGEGMLSMGTEVVWSTEKNQIEVTNVSSQPVRLENVRRTRP